MMQLCLKIAPLFLELFKPLTLSMIRLNLSMSIKIKKTKENRSRYKIINDNKTLTSYQAEFKLLVK